MTPSSLADRVRAAAGLACLSLFGLARATGSSDPAPTPAELRLATWNIEWLARSPGQGKVPRVPADYARLRAYAERLDADVVALQEIDGPDAAARVFDPTRYGFHFTSDVESIQRSGFAYKKTVEVVPYPDLVELAVGGTRRGAEIGVVFGGRELRLLSIHLKTGCWGDPLGTDKTDCSILRAQLPVLEAWIDERAREGTAFAVLGDFNRRLAPRDPFWLELDDRDPPQADLQLVTEGHAPACWGGAFPELVDHVVLDPQLTRLVRAGSLRELAFDGTDRAHRKELSDHCPLSVVLSSTPESRAAAQAPPLPVLSAAEARSHIGESATVCGRVASTKYARKTPGAPTFLNLDRPYPHQSFTVVIWGTERGEFGTPETTYAEKRICITGLIRSHKGKAEIIARKPAQISVGTSPKAAQ